jgi:hypothetical protein
VAKPPPSNPADAKQRGTIIKDPELIAMQRINRIISQLPNEPMKIRVLSWIKSKLDAPAVQPTEATLP